MEYYLRNSYPYIVKNLKTLTQEQKDKILEYMRTHRICEFCNRIYESTKVSGTGCCSEKVCQESKKEKLQKIKEKREQNNIKKYGTKYFLNMEKRKEAFAKRTPEQKQDQRRKAKETLKRKYGDENYNNPSKSTQTKIEKYGSLENYNSHLSRVIKEAQEKVDYNKANEKRKKWRETKIIEDPDFVKKQTLKSKQTKLKRYGDENYNNIEKQKQTVKLKYDVSNISQIPGVQDKVKETNIKKFGAIHAMKTEEYLNKAKNSCLKKYGVEWAMQNSEIKAKAAQTCVERYGIACGAHKHLKNLENLNADFISKNFIVKGDLRYHEALEYFGYKSTITPILGILDESGIRYNIKKRCSLLETDFLNELSYFLEIDILRQYKLKPFNYRADGYIDNINFKFKTFKFSDKDKVVIEFLGDYWHGKPNNSELTYFGESFENLHKQTFERFQELKDAGYRILYIWESDYAENGVSSVLEF